MTQHFAAFYEVKMWRMKSDGGDGRGGAGEAGRFLEDVAAEPIR